MAQNTINAVYDTMHHSADDEANGSSDINTCRPQAIAELQATTLSVVAVLSFVALLPEPSSCGNGYVASQTVKAQTVHS